MPTGSTTAAGEDRQVDALLAENARLASENGRLLAELAAARDELASLLELARRAEEHRNAADARAGELTSEVGRLAGLVAQSNERIAELLAIAQRKKRGKRKKPKAPEPPPDLDDAGKAKFADRPKAPEAPPKPKKSKEKQKPTGRRPVPEHLPAEEHTVEPDACSSCGGKDLGIIDEEVETKLTVVKEHQRRRVVRRKVCRCKTCGERTTATSLPAPFARSKVTCEWLAWLVWMKFVLLVPLDRIRRDLELRGVHVSMSFLVDQIRRASELLDAIDGVHWKALLAGAWMATDATGLKVQVPGLPGTHYGHLEVYRRDDLVVVQYEAEKGAATLANKLKPFAGVLVADAEHRHNAVFEDGRVLEAGCNAHGRRRLRDAQIARPVLAEEGGAFIAAIYIAEGKARERKLTGDDLRAWRQEHVPPLMKDFLAWMDAVEPTLLPGEALAKTIRYYRNHWQALFRFVDHPEIPIDNSASEREFQNVAKLRHAMLFAGSTEGAHRAATLLGVAGTCRALGVAPLAYLVWAFERRGTHKAAFGLSAAETTPAAFKAELDAA